MYIELHARSAFSFLEGGSVPEEFAEVCAQYKMPAMALLDRDGVYGAPRFHLAAQKLKVKAHIGAEITSLLGCGQSNTGGTATCVAALRFSRGISKPVSSDYSHKAACPEISKADTQE